MKQSVNDTNEQQLYASKRVALFCDLNSFAIQTDAEMYL